MFGFGRIRKFWSGTWLDDFDLQTRTVEFTLDRLPRGVDNVRYDVRLSHALVEKTRRVVLHLICRHAHVKDILNFSHGGNILNEENEFKRTCRQVMLDGLNNAKMTKEIQINFLVQAAVVKMLIFEIRQQYDHLLIRMKELLREYEIARDVKGAMELKARLGNVQENRSTILSNMGKDLFELLIDVQKKDLKKMREINFGEKVLLPDYVFSNPLFHVENFHDDGFMIDEYDILIGRRIEDPDKYEILIELIKDSLIKLEQKYNTESEHESRDRVEGWLTEIENVDLIFDCYSTEKQYNRLKNGKNDKKKLKQLKKLYRRQKQMLDFFSKDLNKASFARTRQLCQTANAGSKGRRLIIEGKKTGLINRIRASYQMMSVYDRYCPPLIPQLIIQYITTPGVRKSIEIRLNRLRQFYGKSFSTIPLKKAVVNAKTLNKDKTRKIFLRFLRGFIRFHRDYQSYLSVKQAMDNINLTFADRIIHLSRANNTLHEFLLPGERTREEKPIINHVVIKADIRGSTDITHHMMEMGLNPASFFSLNFFDPIRKILPEYDALKVFVEGDAMILSIFERERTPDKWYCVARACGLAADILAIVNRYNVKSVQNDLPIIELGIGVSFKKGMPAFLFDGNHRIMISSAINLADRLSGCTKSLKKMSGLRKGIFNLRVFQAVSDAAMEQTADDLFLRYNVNGIELNPAGFEKLSDEIELNTIELLIKHRKQRKIKIHTGRFPTANGYYKRLFIREAGVPRMDQETLNINGMTSRKYYEVCTNPDLIAHVEKKMASEKEDGKRRMKKKMAGEKQMGKHKNGY